MKKLTKVLSTLAAAAAVAATSFAPVMANPVLACEHDHHRHDRHEHRHHEERHYDRSHHDDEEEVIIILDMDYDIDPTLRTVVPMVNPNVNYVPYTFPGYPGMPGYPVYPGFPGFPGRISDMPGFPYDFPGMIPGYPVVIPGGRHDGFPGGRLPVDFPGIPGEPRPHVFDHDDDDEDDYRLPEIDLFNEDDDENDDTNRPVVPIECDTGIPAPEVDDNDDVVVTPSVRPGDEGIQAPVVDEQPVQTPSERPSDPVVDEQPSADTTVADETPAAPAAQNDTAPSSSSSSSSSSAPASSGAPAGGAETRVLGANANGIEGFVRRLYVEVLDREADEVGVRHWVGLLRNNRSSAAQVANGFFGSQEFLRKDIDDEEFVDMLYSTFFNREPDEQGREHWLNVLDNGMSRQSVINGFIASSEWSDFCATYSIKAR